METHKLFNNPLLDRILIPASIIMSGLCWYFSNGLNGNFWYLLWLAPIPVLLISFKVSARATFFISFIAYLIGKLSWFNYLATVLNLARATIFIITLPVIFALIMMATRRMVLNTNAWYAVFAFPVFFTAFELLLIKLSPDGTAASIAYSQLDFAPIIQIASVTGILGITFIITFIPSALAVGWHYRKERNKLMPLAIFSFILIASVLFFGFVRIGNGFQKPTTVGLVVLAERSHKMGKNLNFQNELEHLKNYTQEIAKLAAQGAKLVVLPERAININKETDPVALNILTNTAKQNHVAIVTGYTNFKNDQERNSALVITDEGNVVVDYNKVHLIKGLESQFTPGSEIGLFKFCGMPAGTAICKDLDFPDYIKKYGTNKVNFICIPAWDFVVDDWLHSRMAILRGVENGFSEIRVARLGRLTISDYYGRVTSEANCSNGQATALVGKVSTVKKNTFYDRFGSWFEIIIAAAAVYFLLIMTIKNVSKEWN